MSKITISQDFSKTPGGRYIAEGPYSGELFRKELLAPKYQESISKNEKLIIDFDGCYGFPSSFIDESFGHLARELCDKTILNKMELISNDQPSLIKFIESCVDYK